MRIPISLLLCAAALIAGDQTGRRAPGFALPDVNMKLYDLADYRGKVLVLEFMQTDCPHCGAFASVLSQVEKKYGAKVAIMAVANTPHENSNTVGQYVSSHGIDYPVVFDSGQMEYSYVRKMSIDNPYVFIIDANGVIRDDFGYSAFTKDLFDGNGIFAVIDRALAPNASIAPKK
jgi:peroxiredoxin